MSAEPFKPKFEVGEILAEPGVMQAIYRAIRLGDGNYMDYLMRHAEGDWGEVSEHVRELNDAGVRSVGLLRSKYTLKDGTVLQIISEGDRSETIMRLLDQP